MFDFSSHGPVSKHMPHHLDPISPSLLRAHLLLRTQLARQRPQDRGKKPPSSGLPPLPPKTSSGPFALWGKDKMERLPPSLTILPSLINL